MVKHIAVTLKPDADGTLHLPLPPGLGRGMLRVSATVEVADVAPAVSPLKGFGALRGKIWMASDFDQPLEDFKDYT